MMQQMLYEELARERIRANDERARRAYVRQLGVVRRRQRRADAARRHLLSISVQ